MSPYPLTIQDTELHLLPDKALYWPAQQALLLADLHLGKAAHFRRHGLAVPEAVHDADLLRLRHLLDTWQPATLLLLGDLFHSIHNTAWERFADFLQGYGGSALLVQGNHDILAPGRYADAGIVRVQEPLLLGGLSLWHEVPPDWAGPAYALGGHVHPGVRLRGAGRQQLRLPCFHFGAWRGLLPAFGGFTGLAEVPVQPGDIVVAVADGELLRVQ
ncbi:MAG: ligase-associated DNA damage response endonuclease PdeM [Bacteroidia bacterium]